jgi:uncharacterized protein (UPF0548 family)
MFTLLKPTDQKIESFLAGQQQHPFSYPEIGESQKVPPAGYNVDHNRIQLGTGANTFQQAVSALHAWEMFNLGWVQLCWPNTPIALGSTVAVLVHALGLWSLNACRIVYTIQETGPIERVGFAYGTLLNHAERGEERFSVEWHHADDTVWYDIFAFSQPNHLLSMLGQPYVRRLQQRFANDSMQAMKRVAG